MFNNNDDIEMDDRLDKVMYLQDDVSALRRVEINRRRNEKNRLRQDEINHLQNERNRLNQDEVNRRQNERNRLDRDNVNRRQNERNRLNRGEVNHRQNVRSSVRQGRMYFIARSNAIPDYNYLGEMNKICQHCGAKKFPDETHILCCHNGKVALPSLSPFTQVLQDLLTGNYLDPTVVQPINHGPPCFKICGQIYHRVGNLRPDQDILPLYSQLYIYDLLAAVNFRLQQCGNDLCLRDLMFQLQTIITEQSLFALTFKNTAEVEHEEIRQAAIEGRQASVVKMSILEGGERRRYNLPSHDEVGVVFVGEDGAPPTYREVVFYPRGHPSKFVSSMLANLDPTIYSLFFPRGDAGWHNQLVHNPERATLVRNHVILSQFYNYRLSVRQFFCQRHAFIRNNQNKLRSEQYDVLHEHVNNIANKRNVRPGRVVILPSFYIGSPRALKEIIADAMAINKKLLKDVCNNKFLFGGKVIHFGGDFRQILPVVKRGQPAEIVESCIKCSLQRRWVQKFTLTESMRVHDGEREFSQWLLKLGSGIMPVKEEDPFKGCIEIPK
ncbi:uncharacterized protein LOC136082628 [Hydra vulgaris]|uniref:ATP-dependent DNA helicase n=1 Tax=Hydra vulgaris TaxID=6087 RepID=A0ABM4C8Z6_HYDVU